MKRSDFHLTQEKVDEKLRLSGDYAYRGLLFRFTLNQQKDNRYRGRMTVQSPFRSGPMSFVVKHPYAKAGKQEKTVNYRGITSPTASRSKVKDYIQTVAAEIYADNALSFSKLVKTTIRPDTIYPELAGGLYAFEFIRFRFSKNNSEDTMKKKLQRLTELLAKLPYQPMAEIASSQIADCLSGRPKIDFSLLHDFWRYCLLHHYCVGNNPVSPPASGEQSAKTKQDQLQKLTRVPKRNLDKMNDALLAAPNGPACGVALLESGIPAETACSLRWRDIIWPTDDPSYAIVRLDRPDILCPVHNYDRPLLPIAAMTLHARRTEQSEQFCREELEELWVVSTKSDPAKPMSPSALIQEARMCLIRAGIQENRLLEAKEFRGDPISARILKETYKDTLIRICGVPEGSGTYQFLLGQAIHNDVSSSNYLCFTCPSGSQHLYQYLRAAAPPVENSNTLVRKSQDGRDTISILPDRSDRCAGIIVDVVLQPGEELTASSFGGLCGSMESSSV